MQTEKLSRDVQRELARLTKTDPADWFLVFRARQGIEVVLHALAETRGAGEVITQAFTCATALNPILSAGHIPVYIDSTYADLSLDTSHLQTSAETRALVMQHTFGLESNMKKARSFANKHSLLLLEDSAHQLGMMSRADGEPIADISVHSFGVEKMLPTKFGGAIWVNPALKDRELREAITAAFSSLPIIGRKTRGLARRYRPLNAFLNRTPAFLVPLARTIFVTTGLFEPAIMPEELRGKSHGKPATPNGFILKAMLEGLKKYNSVLSKRRLVTSEYLQNPPSNLMLPKHIPENYAPVRFPLLCENIAEATRLFNVLREEKHYSGRWYRPVIFPGTISPELYNYDPELCPVAEDISARILNLPTNITPQEAKEILDVLHRETD